MGSTMDVSVFGLGYVGSVALVCLARDGASVVGVDVDARKVERIVAGQAPVLEPDVQELLQAGLRAGRIKATISAVEAVMASSVSLICVGTPPLESGALDLSRVRRVCESIGAVLANKGEPHVVVIRSTVLPGTTEEMASVLTENAKGVPVHVAFNPEFLREGHGVHDYTTPAVVVVGTTDRLAERACRRMYDKVSAPVVVTRPGEAELIKLASNAWHATKICFANEVGRAAKALGLDGRIVMDTLIQDTVLNVSPAYMRPGFAYGGSCLPKDVRALGYVTQASGVALPLIHSLAASNAAQMDQAATQILSKGRRRIGLVGLAFKAGTDDLRESPGVALAERLLGRGCDLRIYDLAVREGSLVGRNREYIEARIPHLSSLLVGSLAELVRHSEVLVVAHCAPELSHLGPLGCQTVAVIDVGGALASPLCGIRPEGLAW